MSDSQVPDELFPGQKVFVAHKVSDAAHRSYEQAPVAAVSCCIPLFAGTQGGAQPHAADWVQQEEVAKGAASVTLSHCSCHELAAYSVRGTVCCTVSWQGAAALHHSFSQPDPQRRWRTAHMQGGSGTISGEPVCVTGRRSVSHISCSLTGHVGTYRSVRQFQSLS